MSTGPKGNRVYFGYGTGANGIVQIVDRQQAAERTEGTDRGQPACIRRSPGSICRRTSGAHTAFPMLGHAADRVRQAEAPSRHRRPRPASITITTTPRRRGRRRGATSSRRSARRRPTNASRTGRWCGCSTSPPSRSRSASRSWTVPEVERQFLRARRALRHALVERELDADLLQPRAVHRALQRRRARPRRPRSVAT